MSSQNIPQKFTVMNRVIKMMIFSDILVLGALGFVNPIFAIFVHDRMTGGSIEAAGFAAAIYLLTRAFFQIFIGRYVDRDSGEGDDFWFMVTGSVIIAIVPIFYTVSSHIWHIYLLQMLYGLGSAMAFPTYMGIFTRHIDKFHEGYEWSVHDTATGLSMGTTAIFSGIVADTWGFDRLFLLTSLLTLIGVLFLFAIYRFLIRSR